jgi:hypothetical protein
MNSSSVFRKILPVVFFLHLAINESNVGFSQVTINTVSPNEKNFLVRTKQFIEFLDRFNYKTNFNGDKIDSLFMAKIPRDKMINSLFDLKDPRIDPSGKDFSNDFVNLKTEFTNDIVSKKLLINRYSENIIAQAKSQILAKGSPKKINVFLTQEIGGKGTVKWVINTVSGNFFNFLKEDTAFIRFIPPSSNETDFINLKRALEDINYLQYYSLKEYQPDYLILFYYMLNSGAVKFDYVEEVVYHIIDLPGWCIKVREFNRNEMNSGWLITDISRNVSDKSAYLKTLSK